MDAYGIGKAVFDGVVSIPKDAWLGLERTLQDLRLSTDGRYINNGTLPTMPGSVGHYASWSVIRAHRGI